VAEGQGVGVAVAVRVSLRAGPPVVVVGEGRGEQSVRVAHKLVDVTFARHLGETPRHGGDDDDADDDATRWKLNDLPAQTLRSRGDTRREGEREE